MKTLRVMSVGSFVAGNILVIMLLLMATQVQANPGRDRGYERSDWRLGAHNEILMRTDRGWRRVPGSAIAVGDGWVIGTDRRPGGYGIYRWNGRKFDRMPGAAVQIGGSYHSPWVINDRGVRFEWTGRDWREVRAYRQPRRDSRYHRSYRGHGW